MRIGRLLISAGAMKAGTSWLFKQLEVHPQIETTPIKEIHYFAHVHTPISFLDNAGRIHNFKLYARDCDHTRTVAENAAHCAFFSSYLSDPIDDRWFKRLFVSKINMVKADFSNMACILNDEALAHMKRMAFCLRVLYLLRDPYERLWSHVKFHAAIMEQSLDGFSEADFLRYFENSGAAVQSDYAANAGRMKRRFSDREFKIFYFEDLVVNSQDTLNSVFDFVGVRPLIYDANSLRAVHNAGPSAEPPLSFRRAARPLLSKQFLALEKSGIRIHERWVRPDAI